MLKKTAIRMVIVVAALLVTLPAHELRAQTILSDVSFSPYSLYGLGDPVRQGTSYSLSMGGIAIGDRNHPLTGSYSYNEDIPAYRNFLEKGLQQYRQQKH